MLFAVITIAFFTSLGLYYILRKNVHTQKITANVVNANCNIHLSKNNFYYNCSLLITYSYNNITYSQPFAAIADLIPYKPGDLIDIYIDPSNPNDYVGRSEASDYLIGSILLLPISFIIILKIYELLKN